MEGKCSSGGLVKTPTHFHLDFYTPQVDGAIVGKAASPVG